MSVNKILNCILSRGGVYDVFVMDGPSMVRMELEESKNGGLGCRYENRALAESRSRDLKVCVFSENFLEVPTEMMTVMVDDTGEIYGHDVPYAMPRSKIHEGALWVSSTYVMYPNSIPKSELSFVVLPHTLSFLGKDEGAENVVAFNPSIPASIYLRERFGFEGPKNVTTTVIAMDLLDLY